MLESLFNKFADPKAYNSAIIRSVIKRPSGSTTGTTSRQADTTSRQTSATREQTRTTTEQTNGQTSTTGGKTSTTSR